MKSKKNFGGMLAMALVFGMMFASCSCDDGDTNYFGTLDLDRGAPSPAALNAGGLTQAQYDQILTAAGGGGFQGWTIEENNLLMVWTGRSKANFTSTANVLRNLFNESSRGEDEDGVLVARGSRHFLGFFPTSLSEDGYYIPARTLFLFIWR